MSPIDGRWAMNEAPGPTPESPGRWTVKRDQNRWAALFHSFLPSDTGGTYYTITTFPPTEEGERAAKIMAQKLVDIAQGRE